MMIQKKEKIFKKCFLQKVFWENDPRRKCNAQNVTQENAGQNHTQGSKRITQNIWCKQKRRQKSLA